MSMIEKQKGREGADGPSDLYRTFRYTFSSLQTKRFYRNVLVVAYGQYRLPSECCNDATQWRELPARYCQTQT